MKPTLYTYISPKMWSLILVSLAILIPVVVKRDLKTQILHNIPHDLE